VRAARYWGCTLFAGSPQPEEPSSSPWQRVAVAEAARARGAVASGPPSCRGRRPGSSLVGHRCMRDSGRALDEHLGRLATHGP
jgi:hypothetical protein